MFYLVSYLTLFSALIYMQNMEDQRTLISAKMLCYEYQRLNVSVAGKRSNIRKRDDAANNSKFSESSRLMVDFGCSSIDFFSIEMMRLLTNLTLVAIELRRVCID